jgi:branched-chain amino acid aminotransferase
MQSNNYAYVNGLFVPEGEATVSIFDRGFLYGDGVFETMRVYGGKTFRFDEHLQRLSYGLAWLGIAAPNTDLRAVIRELVDRNGVDCGVARISVTRGVGEMGLSTKGIGKHGIVVLARPREFAAPSAGLRVILSSVRLREHSPLEGVKSANRLEYVLAKIEADRAGVDDAVLLNEDGWVVEFTAGNLFVVMGGKLYTSSIGEGGLLGITRRIVIELAGALGLTVEEVGFRLDFLEAADEVFATNSLIEIAPVTTWSKSHEVTNRLHTAYRKLVISELSMPGP